MKKSLWVLLVCLLWFGHIPLLYAGSILFPSVELPEQGTPTGEFGHLTLKDLPAQSNWELTMRDSQGRELWKREIPAGERHSPTSSINHLIPFVVPEAGEYEIRLSRDDKWIIRIHLLSEDNRLWAGESLHEAVLNMLGIMRSKNWYGSPTTNLPIDDPKFVEWVTAREQTLLQQIASSTP